LLQLDGRLSSARRKEKFETDNGVVAAQTSRANAFLFSSASFKWTLKKWSELFGCHRE
jgi:hypothetical protein